MSDNDRSHLEVGKFHFQQAERDLLENHPDMADIQDALIAEGAKWEAQQPKVTQIPIQQAAPKPATFPEVVRMRAKRRLADEDVEDLEQRTYDEETAKLQAWQMKLMALNEDTAGFAILVPIDSIEALVQAYEHYDDHECEVGQWLLYEFLTHFVTSIRNQEPPPQ